MSAYEKQIRATEQYYDQEMRKNEQNGGETISSGVPGSDRVYDWADVLKDLRDNGEAYY